jgi:polar amino acid transport system substrate-binding protein
LFNALPIHRKFNMQAPSSITLALAPTGTLRASINLGNALLAKLNTATQQPFGISIDLAHELARRLGVGVELTLFDSARYSVEAVKDANADIGFFAIDPLRGDGITFTAPYVVIEGGYMVREDSKLQSIEEVDRAGHTIAVIKGSAYDLFLSREIKHAEIVRSPSAPEVLSAFTAQRLDVVAGVKQMLATEVKQHAGLRLLPGCFMEIRQAMVLPNGKGAAAAEYLHQFVQDMKTSGFVQDAIRRHGILGAVVPS